MQPIIIYLKDVLNAIQHSVLAKRASINGLVAAAGFFATLLLNIFLARLMGAEKFGAYMVVFNWVVVLATVGRLGADQTLLRFVAAYRVKGDLGALRGVLIWSWGYVLAASIFVAVITVIVVSLLQSSLDSILVQTFWFGCLLIPLTALNQTLNFSLRGLHCFAQAIFPERIVMPVVIVICGLGMYWSNLVVDSVTIMMVTDLAGIAALVLLVWRLYREVPEGTLVAEPRLFRKEWVQTSMPMVIISVTLVMLVNTDIIMVGMLAGAEDAGIYTASSRLASVVIFGQITLSTVVGPMIAELHSQGYQEELQDLVARVALWIGITVIPVVIVMLVLGEWLLTLFGPSFTVGYLALVILCIGQIVIASCGPVAYLMTMTGYQAMAAKILSGSTLFNVACNLVLIPLYGIAGAAASTSATIVLWNILMVYFVSRKLSIRTDIIFALIRRRFNQQA